MLQWTALRESGWAYPTLEVVHLVGVGLLLGSLVLFELRMLGLGRAIPPAALARLALPVTVAGFMLAAMTGSLMFATQPFELLPNPAFRAKMLLLMVGGANAVIFHARDSLARHDLVARLQAVLSMIVWIGVLACGRLIKHA